MHSLQLPQASPEYAAPLPLPHPSPLTNQPRRPLSVDATGDYVEWQRHACGLVRAERYGTVFSVRRAAPYAPPQVDLTYARRAVPAPPQPVSVGPPSLLGAWLGYIKSQSLTGDQVDALCTCCCCSACCSVLTCSVCAVGGPDRPIPAPKPQRAKPGATASGSSSADGHPQPNRANSVADMANSASAGVSDLYSRLNNALAERG